METIRTINGNGQPKIVNLPKLVIYAETINEVALEHCYQNTGLSFKKGLWNQYEAQPNSSNQIAALLLTWNVKTQYHDNGTNKNTLYLKFCNNEGFKVDSICVECVDKNHIHMGGLVSGDRLAV